MSLKTFVGRRWTLQCYWPSLWTGPRVFGFKVDCSLIFNRYHDGGWSTGFELLGFGVGVMYIPAGMEGKANGN